MCQPLHTNFWACTCWVQNEMYYAVLNLLNPGWTTHAPALTANTGIFHIYVCRLVATYLHHTCSPSVSDPKPIAPPELNPNTTPIMKSPHLDTTNPLAGTSLHSWPLLALACSTTPIFHRHCTHIAWNLAASLQAGQSLAGSDSDPWHDVQLKESI